ncbi:DALR anticodon-binding domain-containing protein 3 isoform X2 [Alligator mississippiensis]|uniref:DALR anticodon-binding domain-containing protein 3 isoform X2 n=1 Tax=Alligator mississippiensis TaxID=8496 RepID=UPI0028777A9E|nr:DALR anticodon-binding domain-containing protein 3 isoform X2 [Alligator mississippiensis]
METGEARLAVADTLAALNAALRRDAGPGLWFKETSARNLRSRDFLAPRGALRTLFPGGQVPGAAVEAVQALRGAAVPPVRSCQQGVAGLAVQLHRTAVFRHVLASADTYARPPPPAAAVSPRVVLHCAALQRRRPAPLGLAQLRAVLLTDHLAAVLRACGANVRLVPAAPEDSVRELLGQLGVDWPWAPEAPSPPEAVAAWKRALSQCPHATAREPGPGADGTLFVVRLRSFLEQRGLQGYDPSLDVLRVTEEELRALAEVERAAQRSLAEAPGSACTVLHVVSGEEELQQQKADLLWRMLEPGALSAAQKHLVCGPVKATSASLPEGASQYYQLRQRQLHKASVMKYGDLAHDESWTEVSRVLTSAAIRFEMLSTAHRSQITLDLADGGISTKGTRSGAFVMYNCARLATLFQMYQQAVEQGTYPALPPPPELDFSCLREEGEWLLLFNHILPFPELLQQAAQLPISSSGIRITANTEAVCRFLVQLSMDFSSYYNRVHILGEPLPHLFPPMLARLQLLSVVRNVLHSALATLHLPPLNQV